MRRMLALLVAVVVTQSAGAQQPPPIEAPAGGTFYGLTPQFAVSPDGQQVVFVATGPAGVTMLWIRPVAAGTPRALAGTEQASYPFWSADSRSVGFFASGKLVKVLTSGGRPVVVCDAPTGRGGTWNADGVIVFTSGITDPLRKVPAAGGQPQLASVLDSPREGSHRWPQFLPDGKHVLFWAGAGSAPAQLKIMALDSTTTTAIGPADTNASYGGGHIYYGRANALMAQRFDAATRQKIGEPVRVAEPLSNDAGSSFASLSASSAGTLLYTQGAARGFELRWFDRSGQPRGVLGQPGQFTNVALRGQCVAVSETTGTPANRDIRIVPGGAAGCVAKRVTTDTAVDATPIWSADGNAVIYSSTRSGPYQVYRSTFAGPDAKEELLFKSDVAAIATDWSRDGRHVAYTRGTAATGFDIWVAPVGAAGPGFAMAAGPGADDSGIFAPDGRWFAYQSNESGRNEIYARRFLETSAGPAVRISTDGGTQPLWRADSREMYYLALDGAVMAVPVATGNATLVTGSPARLFTAPVSLVIRRSYDVSADGQNFLIPTLERSRQTITVAPPRAMAQSAPPPPAAAPAEFLQTFDAMPDLDAAWTKSAWANTNRAHSPDNVTIANGILELKLSATAPGAKPVCAEIASRRRDFFHGTYRASIKMSKVPGAVVGWFTYLGNPLNEIDVEFLTRDPRKAHFTLHHIRTGVDSAKPLPEMPFDPSEAFHEYRFDWYADRVEYYVDGTKYATLTKEVPDTPSRLMLNHWSGNIPTWGGPAPTEDALMLVDWVYYSPEYRAPSIPAAR